MLLGSIVALGAVLSYPVLPSATDPAIDQFDSPHRVFLDRDAPPRGQVLVYLPGTGATTSDQDEFGKTAAALGYHVLYLMYPNDIPAASVQDDPDPDAFENFRREVIDGRDRHANVEVDPPNSILNRLRRALAWLAANRAEEGWGRFIGAEGVAWELVALVGHSQGGGHAQLIAEDHAVARLVVLGSPKDYSPAFDRPAAWYGGGATPAARQFAFVHTQDTQACSYEQQLENLALSGITRVTTTDHPGTPINSALAHLGLVFDFTLPKRDGEIVYRSIWKEMLTAPTE